MSIKCKQKITEKFSLYFLKIIDFDLCRTDCGIFVIVNIISDNRAEIPLKVSKEKMDKIRAMIVHEVISNHACCWNLVRFVTGLTKKKKMKEKMSETVQYDVVG